MVDRLRAWIFLSISLVLVALAFLPLMRAMLGIDEKIGLPFFTVVMLLIGGLMSGLTAMILLVRRQPKLNWQNQSTERPAENIKSRLLLMHACGLLLFTGLPLINFLVCYWLWVSTRHRSEALDKGGREVLNYQITIYLYLLLSLFMVFAVIGIITTPLLVMMHLVFTLWALVLVVQGKHFKYPLNIPIIQGR